MRDIYSDFDDNEDININIWVPVATPYEFNDIRFNFYTVKKIHFSRLEEVMEWGAKNSYSEETDEGNTFFQDETYAYRYVEEMNSNSLKEFNEKYHNKVRTE